MKEEVESDFLKYHLIIRCSNEITIEEENEVVKAIKPILEKRHKSIKIVQEIVFNSIRV